LDRGAIDLLLPRHQPIRHVDALAVHRRELLVLPDPADVEEVAGHVKLPRLVRVIGRHPAAIERTEQVHR
jgi:hypothetical protein